MRKMPVAEKTSPQKANHEKESQSSLEYLLIMALALFMVLLIFMILSSLYSPVGLQDERNAALALCLSKECEGSVEIGQNIYQCLYDQTTSSCGILAEGEGGFCEEEDDPIPCEMSQGSCFAAVQANAVQTCVGGQWQDCPYGDYNSSYEPFIESFCDDGMDNDCDGDTDLDDFDCSPGGPPECTAGQVQNCEKQDGVCSGSFETCTGDTWPGCTVETYQDYSPFFEEIETLCDGLDNDCDTEVDEDPQCEIIPPVPPVPGDWIAFGPGEGGSAKDVAFNPTNPLHIIYATDETGIEVSEDGGVNWAAGTLGLTGSVFGQQVKRIVFSPDGEKAFLAKRGGVFKSTDKGFSWSQDEDGKPTTTSPVMDLEISGNLLYALAANGKFYRADISQSELSWTTLASIPGFNISAKTSNWPHRIAVDGQNIYVGHNDGIVKSTNGGASWQNVVGIDGANQVDSVEIVDGMVFAAVSPSGVYSSSNGGLSWEKKSNGLPDPPDAQSPEQYGHLKYDPVTDILYVLTVKGGANGNVWKSTDLGENWTSVTNLFNVVDNGWFGDRLESNLIIPMSFDFAPSNPSILMYRDSAHGVMKSENTGLLWFQAYTQKSGSLYKSRSENNHAWSLGIGFHPTAAGNIFIGQSDFGFFHTTDGQLFRYVSDRTPFEQEERGFAVLKYPPTHPQQGQLITKAGDFTALGLVTGAMDAWDFLVEDNGIIWASIANEGGGDEIKTVGGLFLRSSDGGVTFQIIGPQCNVCSSNGLPLNTAEASFYDIKRINGNFFLAAGEAGLYRSTDNGGSWQNILSPRSDEAFTHIAFSGDTIYVTGGFGSFSPESHSNGSVHRSIDGGNSWEPPIVSAGADVRGLAVAPDGTAFFTDYGDGVFKVDLERNVTLLSDAPGAWGLDLASDGVLFVSVDQGISPAGGLLSGVYAYSEDFGFVDVTGNLPNHSMYGAGLKVSPLNPREVFVGTLGGWWKAVLG